MKTLLLIAPSEGKLQGWENWKLDLTFSHPRPLDLISASTEKDLKCKGKRFEEWLLLNSQVEESPTMLAIQRYSGVQFKALDYWSLWVDEKEFLDQHLLICSAMFWLVAPRDMIPNYKLPITTKLVKYWKTHMTQTIVDLAPSKIINLLPWSYMKMFEREKIPSEVIVPEVVPVDSASKANHWVKHYRWLRLHNYTKKIVNQ